jgi:hypothetical protein
MSGRFLSATAACAVLAGAAGCSSAGSGPGAPLAAVSAVSSAAAANSQATTAPPVSDCLTLAKPKCYAPRQFRVAYGIQPLLARGFDGRGQTVVLPEIAPVAGAAGVTDLRQDLARLDSVFSLPAARLRVITRFAAGAAPYLAAGEEAGDAEIVHAIAREARAPLAERVLMPGHAGLGWIVNEAAGLIGHGGTGPAASASLLITTGSGDVRVALANRVTLVESVSAQTLPAGIGRTP